MWTFPVPDENLSIEKGEGILKKYEFGKKELSHMVNRFAIMPCIGDSRILIP